MELDCAGCDYAGLMYFGPRSTTGLTLANFLRMADAGEVGLGKAKSAIFINLQGGPSHIDTFDHKPLLAKYADKTISDGKLPRQVKGKLLPSPWHKR